MKPLGFDRFFRFTTRPGSGLGLRLSLGLATLLTITAPAARGQDGTADGGPSKVIVLGFDGADARLVEKWMDDGRLPNLERLRKQGTYARLLPTNPPQTPVSWSTFATGLDPGQTTIFDFLKRDPDTYFPDFAMMTPSEEPFLKGKNNPLVLGGSAGAALALVLFIILILVTRKLAVALPVALLLGAGGFLIARNLVAKYIPEKRPVAINNRQGLPFWVMAGENGIRSTVIRVPATFPPRSYPNGRLLSGLGVPDIRKTFGTYSYYTSEIFGFDEDTEKGGKVIPVDVERGTEGIETFIYGPFNDLFDEPPEIHIPLNLSFDWNQPSTTVTVSGSEFELRPGQWSDWVVLTFPFNPIVKLYGMTRFYLISMEPDFRLYMQAVNLHPTKFPTPITYPKGFAGKIKDKIGLWKTLGWAIDTWALDEEVIDEDTFEEDMYFTVGKFEEIMKAYLEDPADRLFVQVFYFTDRAGHMFMRVLNEANPGAVSDSTFWRLVAQEHPAYDPAVAAAHGNFILESYEKMDEMVGWTMDHMPEDAVLLICSDHGFSPWTYSFNMNTWLWQNGLLALKGDQNESLKTLDDLFVEGEFWPNVDWDRTKAYALGLGAIYVNVLGREANGIVPPGEEYERVCAEIVRKLEAYVDPSTGVRPVSKVYRREEMYAAFDPDLIPDLRAANSLGYRVSWQTSLGGIPKDLFELHKEKWSGDHCSLDPEVVKGIFFASWKGDLGREPYIADLCPTILELLDVPVPEGLSGSALRLTPTRGLLGRAAVTEERFLRSIPYLGTGATN